MAYYGSLRKVSSSEERIEEAKKCFKVLKGLQQNLAFESVAARMARKLPESGSFLAKWLRDLPIEKREEIGFGTPPETKPNSDAPLRPRLGSTRHSAPYRPVR